jgi:hypothetical protein
MSTEFSQDAPGISVTEIPSQPAPEAIGLDMAGIVGQFRRGPTDESLVATDWADFTRKYGGFYNGNYGPLASYFFFKQRYGSVGANQLAISRVVGTGATAGTVNLADSVGIDTLQMDASSVGAWANDAEITTTRYEFTIASAIPTGVPLSEIDINEADAFSYIEVGDYVHFVDKDDSTKVEKAFVREVDTDNKLVKFKEFTPTNTIQADSYIRASTSHRAISTLITTTLRNHATELEVESAKNFKKGMRILIDDSYSTGSGNIGTGLIYRVSGNKIFFDTTDPLSLIQEGNFSGYITALVADFVSSNDLVAFDNANLTNDIATGGLTFEFTSGDASGDTYTIDAFTESSGKVDFTTNITKDADPTDSFEIAGVTLSGTTTSAGVAGVQATGQIKVVDSTWGGGETITVGDATYTEGVDFTAGVDNETTRDSILSAITSSLPTGYTAGDFVAGDDTVDFWIDITYPLYGTAGNAEVLTTTALVGDLVLTGTGTLTGGIAATIVDTDLGGFDAASGIGSGTYSGETITGFDGTDTITIDDATTAISVGSAASYSVTFTFTSWNGITSCAHNTFTDTSLTPANNDGETLNLVGLVVTLDPGASGTFEDALTATTATITNFDETTGTVTFDGAWDDVPTPGPAEAYSIANVPNVPFTVTAGANVVSQEFNLIAYDRSEKIDEIWYLSLEPTNSDYIESRVSDTNKANESVLLEATDLSSATASSTPTGPVEALPAPISRTSLSGGSDGAAPTDTQVIGSGGTNKTGIYLFDDKQISYFAIPGYYNKTIVDAADDYLSEDNTGRGDSIFVTCVPETTTSALKAKEYRNVTLNYKSSSFTTMLGMWIYSKDPESDLINERVLLPPEGHYMGMWTRVVEQYKESQAKAPANEEVFEIVDVAYNVPEQSNDAGLLNNAGINVIFWRQSSGQFIAYGARTLDRNPGKRQFNSVRNLLNWTIRELYRRNEHFPYQVQSPAIANQIVMTNNKLFEEMQKDGMLDTLTVDNPYNVVSNSTNNTTADLRAGKRKVQVLFEPAVPIEQLGFEIGITTESVTVSEF